MSCRPNTQLVHGLKVRVNANQILSACGGQNWITNLPNEDANIWIPDVDEAFPEEVIVRWDPALTGEEFYNGSHGTIPIVVTGLPENAVAKFVIRERNDSQIT